MATYGISSLLKGGNNSRRSFNSKGGSSLKSVRVKSIILDASHEYYWDFGGPNAVGLIFWEDANYPTLNPNIPLINFPTAFPLYSNINQYPLINELVSLVNLSDSSIIDNSVETKTYYFPPINVWNSVHHNAIPAPTSKSPLDTKDYQQTTAGAWIRTPEDENTLPDVELGIIEKLSVHKLKPFPGDITLEGRWGNSIRFGSTTPILGDNLGTGNTWSTGPDGDPITIIRNGQPKNTGLKPWDLITENINEDMSSIYLTTSQIIHVFSPIINESYSNPNKIPIPSDSYEKPQIILNSGRLFLNAEKDSIILNSLKSLHLSSQDSVNVDGANNIVLASKKVYLGSSKGEEATLTQYTSPIQSGVKGEQLINLLTQISLSLQAIQSGFSNAITDSGDKVPSLIAYGDTLKELNSTIKDILNSNQILSTTVKII